MKKETRQVSVTCKTYSDEQRKVQISLFADNVIISVHDSRFTSEPIGRVPRIEVTIPKGEADQIFAHMLRDMKALNFAPDYDEFVYRGCAPDDELKD